MNRLARVRALGGICIAAIVLAAPTPANAAPAPANAAPGIDTSAMVTADAATTPDAIRRTTAYWTPERMTTARPVTMAVDRAPHRAAPAVGAAVTRTPEWFGPSGASPQAGGFPWDGFAAAPIAQRTGKLFFTLPGTGNSYCSASVVSSQNRDLVWTAAHCLYESGAFATNVVFVPFYHNGQSPNGTWTARQVRITPEYAAGSLLADVGAVVLNTGGLYGLHVADHVGALAIAFFQPTDMFVYTFGYPTQPFLQYDGEELIYCLGFTANRIPGLDPPSLRAECDMREGASGGPWTAYFNGFFGTVIAVSSYYLPGDPPGAYLYGAYNGQAARNLYEGVRSL